MGTTFLFGVFHLEGDILVLVCIEAMGACFGAMSGLAFGAAIGHAKLGLILGLIAGLCWAIPFMVVMDLMYALTCGLRWPPF